MSPTLRWSSLGLLSAALACAGSVPTGTPELEGSISEDRIVGGAAFSGAPGVGALLRNGAPHCTGTLVDNRRVVTAAHCFYNNANPASWRFVVGSNAKAPDETYAVASIRVHPSFSMSTVVHDIAVVTLSTSATEAPMKVLDNLDSSWVGAELFFVGYGVDNGQRQSGLGIKRAVSMPISEVGPSQFAYETAGKNTCSGDSGGPAFFVDQQGTFLLAGVTSYGDTYCTQYGVDTIVPEYAAWIGVTGTAPNSAPPPEPVDPCGGETFEGRCTGNTVTWCEDDHVYEVDCSIRGKVCGFSELDGFTGCMARPRSNDPCGGETYKGRCSGESVIWCEGNAVQRIDCGANGGACTYDSTRGINNCTY